VTSTTGGVRVAWEDAQLPGRPRRIRQLMNSELVCPTIERVLHSAAMLDTVAALMPSPAGITLYHSKLLMKSGVDGSFTPFHQDWGYWHPRFHAPTHVNCMLAIDAMTEANGGINPIATLGKQLLSMIVKLE
jgi:ectoine hydroxylase-related dioxygenase (phytanoyl-CoA dioxygenase family)